MSLFLPLLLKMTGLYACIGMGWIAARRLKLEGEGISQLLFHLIVPLVFFHGVARAPMQGATLALPLIVALLSCLLALLGLALARAFWPKGDPTPHLLAFTAGNGNMGYFGIPVALMIFSTETVALYMLMIIGVILYEATLGYALVTRGHFHPRVALRKILTLPMLHGALLGLLFAVMRWPLPEFLEDFFLSVRSTYSVLGMMMVGIALSGLRGLALDSKFLAHSFLMKFLAWPLLTAGFVWLDRNLLGWYGANIHQALMLLSLAPLAVMSIIFATLFKNQPEKMATAVFLSTCFALVYVPLMIGWLGLGG